MSFTNPMQSERYGKAYGIGIGPIVRQKHVSQHFSIKMQ